MSDLSGLIKAIEKFIPADPTKSDYTQGISVGLAIATLCVERFSQENAESSQGLVKDLISRQDAIDAFVTEGSIFVYGRDVCMAIVSRLMQVPSAEKAQLSEEDATKDATSGLIKKQDAIDAILGLTSCDTAEKLRTYVKGHDLGLWWSGGVLSSIEKVERLPSTEPKTPSNGSITSINPENTHDRTMGDCISRKDVVGGIDK